LLNGPVAGKISALAHSMSKSQQRSAAVFAQFESLLKAQLDLQPEHATALSSGAFLAWTDRTMIQHNRTGGMGYRSLYVVHARVR
jgi:hypothetical protein